MYDGRVKKLAFAVAVTCFGCGDDSSSVGPDARPGDDAAVAADCTAAAPVTVVNPGFDPKDVQLTTTLVAHDATGTMCSTSDGSSEPEGRATIDVPPGGMVTLALDGGTDYRGLFTWTEVQPGDELRFPLLEQRGASKTVEVVVVVPALADVSSFDVYVQCEHGGGGLSTPTPAGPFTKQVECPASATAVAVMVEAEDATSTRYAVSAVTPIAASGATTLTLGAWMPAASPTVTVHGTAGFDQAIAGFVPGAEVGYQSVQMASFANAVTDPLTIGPRHVPATWRNRTMVALSKSTEPGETLQLSRDQATPASLDVATATDFLPRLSGQLVAPLPRPSITWSMSRDATADAVSINAGHWVIVARPQPGTVRFPEVPAALLPTGPASVVAINLIESPTVADFAAHRTEPLRAYNAPDYTLSSIGDLLSGILP